MRCGFMATRKKVSSHKGNIRYIGSTLKASTLQHTKDTTLTKTQRDDIAANSTSTLNTRYSKMHPIREIEYYDRNHAFLNDLRDMRYRQINECFGGTKNDLNNNQLLRIADGRCWDESHISQYSFWTKCIWINNFDQRILDHDSNGNVVLRISNLNERPKILQMIVDNVDSNDQLLLRYYIDLFYMRINVLSKMIHQYKTGCNDICNKIEQYFDKLGNDTVLEQSLMSQICDTHANLIELKSEILKNVCIYRILNTRISLRYPCSNIFVFVVVFHFCQYIH